MSIQLSKKQLEAVSDIRDWFHSSSKQSFTLAGYAGCLDENTLIQTKKGVVRLKDIIVKGEHKTLDFEGWGIMDEDIEVFTHKSRYRRIEKVFATPVMTGYKITLSNGMVITASEDHPFWVGAEKWVKASEILLRDEITLNARGYSNSFNRKLRPSNTLKIAGAILGTPYANEEEDDLDTNLAFYLGHTLPPNHELIDTAHSGMLNDRVIETIEEIRTNKEWYPKNLAETSSFLQGLVLSTVSVGIVMVDIPSEYNQVMNVSMTIPEFMDAHSVQNMLQDLGIGSYMSHSSTLGNRLHIRTDDVKLFDETFTDGEILLGMPEFQSMLFDIRDRDSRRFWRSERVVAIEEVKQKFYDITVADDSSFVSNNIVSHNTGKTTIISDLPSLLGIPLYRIAYVTPTGKASMVLRQKGIDNAQTLHSLMFFPFENEKGELKFKRRDEIDDNFQLIVVDESSMLNDNIIRDIESFGRKVLYVGDGFQLPPVKGVNKLFKEPDHQLEEVHRQALENSILYLATEIRGGADLPEFGNYGDNVYRMNRDEFNMDHTDKLLRGQVLCGTNRTRSYLNQKIRSLRGYKGDHPNIGEKVIILQNDHDKGIVNGMFARVTSEPTAFRRMVGMFSMGMVTETGVEISEGQYDLTLYEHKLNETVDRRLKFKYIKTDFGYAITVHKSQGSEFPRVILFNETFMRGEERMKWLYTAITRARDNILIVG